MKRMTPFLRLMKYAKPHKRQMIWATICSILNMMFDILPEILIGVAVNVVINQEHSWLSHLGIHAVRDQLIVLGIITFLVWFLESIFEYGYSVLWRTLGQKVQHELRMDAYQHIQQFNMAYYENVSTGTLLSILNDDINQMERFLDNGINKFVQLGTSTIIILLIFFYLAPTIALFVLIPVPFIFLTGFYFQNQLAPRYMKVRERAAILAARLINNITGIVTIKSYTAENYELDRLGNDSRAYKLANREVIKIGSAFIPIVRMILAVGFIATIVIGGIYVLNGKLDVGSYSILAFQTQRFLWPFTELAEMIDSFERAMASVKRVFNLLSMPIEVSQGQYHVSIDQVKGDIRFDQVSFMYPNGVEIFDKLSLEILPGSTVAFVGATGAGKSTIIKLLLRFYEPTHGHIYLDGLDIKQMYLKDLRKIIGLVSQEVFLFYGTIKENISYGSFDASEQAIIQAAKKAEAHDFIMELPHGYDTMIGERGQRLSGGQRQRISIARALLKNPPIVIFDEATSALDVETEIEIRRSIERMAVDHTLIMIAHRLSTVRKADTIFVIEQGQVVEKGSHSDLMQKNGIYAQLWRLQTGEKENS